MDFQMNTGKLEICMEKSTEKNWCTGKNRQILFFGVSQSIFFIWHLFHAAFWKVFGKCMEVICRILCNRMS